MLQSNRIARIRAAMQENHMDCLLLVPSTDLFYLTGMRIHMYERLVCCLVTQEEVHFVSPQFEIGNQDEETRRILSCHGWTDGEDPFRIMDSILPRGELVLAVGASVPSWVLLAVQALRPGYHYQSAEAMMRSLRMAKDEAEKQLVKESHRKSDAAFLRLMEHGICGLTELQAAKLLMEYMEEAGLEIVDGVPIVGAGPNGALPHHVTDDTLIQPGDVVVIDYGGENRGLGYICDTTRTVAVKRKADGLQEIYDIVKAANQAAFEAARPGVRCCDVDKVARDLITEAGYGQYFTHRLGHGLGLDVHEHPYLSSDNQSPLAVGNVVSDEPGIYLPGRFGVRIEDILFIGADGAERMQELTHDLMIVD